MDAAVITAQISAVCQRSLGVAQPFAGVALGWVWAAVPVLSLTKCGPEISYRISASLSFFLWKTEMTIVELSRIAGLE